MGDWQGHRRLRGTLFKRPSVFGLFGVMRSRRNWPLVADTGRPRTLCADVGARVGSIHFALSLSSAPLPSPATSSKCVRWQRSFVQARTLISPTSLSDSHRKWRDLLPLHIDVQLGHVVRYNTCIQPYFAGAILDLFGLDPRWIYSSELVTRRELTACAARFA